MADLIDMPHFHAPPRYDGAPHCVLCSSTELGAGNEWCRASQCLVCDECCTRLLQGEMARLIAIVANTGKTLTHEMLFESCAGCERAHRRFAESMLEESAGDSPVC
jgi:hypothetical protein